MWQAWARCFTGLCRWIPISILMRKCHIPPHNPKNNACRGRVSFTRSFNQGGWSEMETRVWVLCCPERASHIILSVSLSFWLIIFTTQDMYFFQSLFFKYFLVYDGYTGSFTMTFLSIHVYYALVWFIPSIILPPIPFPFLRCLPCSCL
jgi:hypothetical protein